MKRLCVVIGLGLLLICASVMAQSKVEAPPQTPYDSQMQQLNSDYNEYLLRAEVFKKDLDKIIKGYTEFARHEMEKLQKERDEWLKKAEEAKKVPKKEK